MLVDARHGRLTGERLRAAVPGWQEASVWFCGPAGFGEALEHDPAGKSLGLIASAAMGLATTAMAQPVSLTPSTMPRIGTVDARYQSYNVEMLEVTGGRFWKPCKDIAKLPREAAGRNGPTGGDTAAGMSADLYQHRPPIDLANPRLRMLAKALAPAYVRISGTWANTTYFAATDTPPKEPPKGYGGVLTRQQWVGAIAFSNAVDAPIVTSMPIGEGTRGPDGVWTPDQARRWLDFTQAHGGKIAAVEFFNEPTPATMGVAHGGYGDMNVLPAAALAAYTGDADAFSYHHYGAASERCAAMGHQTSAAQALSEDWLGRTDQTLAFYRAVRDKFMPGKPFWNTETADAACGGNPWGGTFLDTFRCLDQLGRLALAGGVALLAINNSLSQATTIELPAPAERYTLSAPSLKATSVQLNGQEIKLGQEDALPTLQGQAIGAGKLELAPRSITFLALAQAGNASCRERTRAHGTCASPLPKIRHAHHRCREVS